MDTRTPISHDIAYLSDLKVTQDGEYVKIANDLDTNLRALDTAIQSGGGGGGDVSGKADKVANATEGNFAGLDNTGNLTDSTKSPADFAAADHTHDSLVNGGASLDLASNGTATVTVEGAGGAGDVTKTLATTDDIPNADNTTIENNSGTLSVKDGGITSAKLAPAISSAISNSLKESDLDGTTIEKDATNGVQVKDGAITTAKLAGLHGIVLIDDAEDGTYAGKQYRLSILNGRLSIEEI